MIKKGRGPKTPPLFFKGGKGKNEDGIACRPQDMPSDWAIRYNRPIPSRCPSLLPLKEN